MIKRILPRTLIPNFKTFGILPHRASFKLSRHQGARRCCPETMEAIACHAIAIEDASEKDVDVIGRLSNNWYDFAYLSQFWSGFDWASDGDDVDLMRANDRVKRDRVRDHEFSYPHWRGFADGVACAKACVAVFGSVPTAPQEW
jgi:hypothetical protein